MSIVRKYLVATFSITYLFWGIIAIYTQVNQSPFSSSVMMYVFYVVGVIGPAIGAITVKKTSESKADFRTFLRSCYKPPRALTPYVYMIVIVLFFSFLPYFIVGGEQGLPIQYILLQIPAFIIIGGFEEIGWRGVLLPELLKRLSALQSTVLVSIIWVLWHLPLFFMIGTFQNENLNIPVFTINVFAFSFLLSTVFYKTNSVFLCILTHAFCNSVQTAFISHQTLVSGAVGLAFSILIYALIPANRNRPPMMNNVETYVGDRK
ncbi:CAAX amino terminal protease family protein [Fictibacillus macauensis ZFHKF-1]|uniref:CAAX amino terminal protease family protein n=1 Tax=Fictibacillus macauensis ZFHKF-1 TaxID=1196324 RepID=I8UD76_9BACL|nr:type II CAAX endopeptidase family protein [Fictibacillus macauensis]EIT84880.1 CAAX amino terminal protease family protein [Fictibacillus macauensis ZFHKF-1]